MLTSLQWVFCVFTCNHPPQQTHHPEPSALPSSQSFREEGPLTRYARRLRSDTRPDPTEFQTIYSKIWLISRWVYIAPLVNRSKAQVLQGGAGGQSPTDGVPFTLAISETTYIWFDCSPFLSILWRMEGGAIKPYIRGLGYCESEWNSISRALPTSSPL